MQRLHLARVRVAKRSYLLRTRALELRQRLLRFLLSSFGLLARQVLLA